MQELAGGVHDDGVPLVVSGWPEQVCSPLHTCPAAPSPPIPSLPLDG